MIHVKRLLTGIAAAALALFVAYLVWTYTVVFCQAILLAWGLGVLYWFGMAIRGEV